MLDFSTTQVSVEYSSTVDQDSLSLPENLKFYEDAQMQKEFTKFNGISEVSDSNRKITKSIYWKWAFSNDDENEWQDKDLILK